VSGEVCRWALRRAKVDGGREVSGRRAGGERAASGRRVDGESEDDGVVQTTAASSQQVRGSAGLLATRAEGVGQDRARRRAPGSASF
jgi:hypothetical protein